ncbi:MAG: SDR family oxidoreductase [Xanthomonadales bacterium]|jgi:NAD(P)-dependent dehydrogenase (short-subunit alcohol dehydrogenase family)|nr:SDR family oxidoreductase [Xanthomonadales bacterium]
MNNAIITGANRGIGLELTRQLLDRGWRVTALCRSVSDALAALETRGPGLTVISGFDVTDQASIDGLADRLPAESLDLLINNAGILEGMDLEEIDPESIRRQFEVNALGPLRVTRALLPALGQGAKVALVTSRMGSIADNTSGGSYGYRMSKAALNAAGKSLAHDLASRGVHVAILHPGYVRTDMTGGRGLIDVEEAAGGILERLDELTEENSGTFWHSNGEILPW